MGFDRWGQAAMLDFLGLGGQIQLWKCHQWLSEPSKP